ncbi:MAG: DUF1109 family protein [Polyangiaceae bacterium]|nr:DUF1109 family protein [Polyangiaceae bacterium]
MSADPPGHLRARVLESAARDVARRRPLAELAWTALAVALGLVAALAALGVRADWHELPGVASVGTASVLCGVSAGLLRLGLSPGRRMLGPRAELAIIALLALPTAIAAWLLATTATGPSSTPCPTAEAALALSPPCLLLTLALSLPVAAALVRLRRAVPGGSPALTGALAGAAAATLAHLVVHLHCAVAHPLHLLTAHLSPLFLVATLTALLAARTT